MGQIRTSCRWTAVSTWSSQFTRHAAIKVLLQYNVTDVPHKKSLLTLKGIPNCLSYYKIYRIRPYVPADWSASHFPRKLVFFFFHKHILQEQDISVSWSILSMLARMKGKQAKWLLKSPHCSSLIGMLRWNVGPLSATICLF